MEMKTSLVQDAMGRTNRNVLLASILGILISVGFFVAALPALQALLAGPNTPTDIELITRTDAGIFGERTSITVESKDDSGETGYAEFEVDGSRETIVAEYHFMFLETADDVRAILVKVGSDAPVQTTYEGNLINIPSDVERDVINPLESEINASGVFIDVMLDTTATPVVLYILLVVFVLVLLASIVGILRVMTRRGDPSKHPIMKKLANFGEPDMALAQIENELAMGSEDINKMQLTRNWIFKTTTNGFDATRYSDVVWIYKMVTQNKTYGVTVNKSYAAHIHDKHGQTIVVPGKEEQVNEMLNAIASRAPWVIAGFSDEIKKAWNDSAGRQQMIQAVEKNKAGAKAKTSDVASGV